MATGYITRRGIPSSGDAYIPIPGVDTVVVPYAMDITEGSMIYLKKTERGFDSACITPGTLSFDGEVQRLKFSKRGRYLGVVGNFSTRVEIYRVTGQVFGSGVQIENIQAALNLDGLDGVPITDIAFSPDEQLCAITLGSGDSPRCRIYTISGDSFTDVTATALSSAVSSANCVNFSDDGQYMIIFGDGTLYCYIFKLVDQVWQRIPNANLGTISGVYKRSAAFINGSNAIIIADSASPFGWVLNRQELSTDPALELWRRSNTIATASGPSIACWDSSCSPDSRYAAVSNSNRMKSIGFIYTYDGLCLNPYIRVTRAESDANADSYGCRFSRDGNYLIFTTHNAAGDAGNPVVYYISPTSNEYPHEVNPTFVESTTDLTINVGSTRAIDFGAYDLLALSCTNLDGSYGINFYANSSVQAFTASPYGQRTASEKQLLGGALAMGYAIANGSAGESHPVKIIYR